MYILNLTRMEIGLILVELSILVSLFVIVFWVNRSIRSLSPGKAEAASASRRMATGEAEKLNGLLQESHSISRRLSQNIAEKKEITQRLMKGLDEKIQNLDRQGHEADRQVKPTGLTARERDIYAKALEMSSAGADPVEISRLLRLPKGEAQLIHDLQKYSR